MPFVGKDVKDRIRDTFVDNPQNVLRNFPFLQLYLKNLYFLYTTRLGDPNGFFRQLIFPRDLLYFVGKLLFELCIYYGFLKKLILGNGSVHTGLFREEK